MPHAEQYTEFVPDEYPPFPEDLPTVALETISLKKLVDGDNAEQQRVFKACKGRGFFYLTLPGTESGQSILDGADGLARLAEDVFKLPAEEKLNYVPGHKALFGYKHVGASVTDKNGTKDTAEFFNVSKNDMIVDGETARQWPDAIMQKRGLFKDYMTACHSTGMMILGILAENLGVPAEEIQNFHKIEEQSGDHVRMTRGPPRKSIEMPEIQTPSHTDFGSITILMNWLGGLQVWSESSRRAAKDALEPDCPGEWLWVKPRPNHAIINLGDAAVKFTNGVLCSGRHRVIPSPGLQGTFPRYSIVYFVRPEDEVILRTLKSSTGAIPEDTSGAVGINAKEWIFQQAQGLGVKIRDGEAS